MGRVHAHRSAGQLSRVVGRPVVRDVHAGRTVAEPACRFGRHRDSSADGPHAHHDLPHPWGSRRTGGADPVVGSRPGPAVEPVRALAHPVHQRWDSDVPGPRWSARSGDVATLWLFLPAVLLAAAANAFTEEVTYKASLLSVLEGPVGPRQAVLMVAAYFGIGHYY